MGEIGEPARRIEVIPATKPVREPMPAPSTPTKAPVEPAREPVPA